MAETIQSFIQPVIDVLTKPIQYFSLSPHVLLQVIICFLTTTAILVFTRLLNAKDNVKEIIGAVVLSALNMYIMLALDNGYMYLVDCITVIIWFGILCITSKKHITENIISACMGFAVLINYLIVLKLFSFSGDAVIASISISVYLFVMIIIYCILRINNIIIFKPNWIKDFFQVDDKKVKKNRNMLISSMLLLVILSMTALCTGIDSDNIKLSIVLSVLSVVLIMLFFLCLKLIVEYCILQDENFRNIRYQQNLEQFMKVIRAQRHDFNVHLHALKGLIDGDNFAECREYIQTIVNDSNTINEVLPIKNPIIGAMVHGFREKADSCGIRMYLDIRYDMSNIAVTAYDLNRILGNLIQNAIDEIVKNKDKKYGIHISINKEDNMTVLDVSNKFSGEGNIDKIFNEQYTTKRRHDGIGLTTVLRIIESYNGIIYPEIQDDIIHFIVRLPNEI